MRYLPFSAALWIAIAPPALAQSISESPNPVAPGAALLVTYSDPGAQPNDNIWIQDANGTQLEIVSLNGSTSGTITSFTAPATPGDYRIYGGFHGTAAGPATFTVVAAATPTGITYSPAAPQLLVGASGTIAGFVVATSDGSPFNGTDTLLTGSDALCVAPASGNGNLTLSRALVAGDVGSHTCKLQATENSASKEVDLTFTVAAPPPSIDMSDNSQIAPGANGTVLGVVGGKWAPGQSGGGATVSVGNTTTGSPGSNAAVTNSGTPSAAVFNFTIPQGSQGNPGQNGTNAGQQGLFTPTSSTMPCSQGQSGFDATYMYGCLSTNHWGRMGNGVASWQTTGW